MVYSTTPPGLDFSEKDFSAWHQGIRNTLAKLARYPSRHDIHCRQDFDQLTERINKTRNPFMKDKRGDTPLHFLLRQEFKSKDIQCHALIMLVNAGHPLDEINGEGHTALQLAEGHDLPDAASTLLNFGARVGTLTKELSVDDLD